MTLKSVVAVATTAVLVFLSTTITCSKPTPSPVLKQQDPAEVLRNTTPWGRIYLQNGLYPIQYFKAKYGAEIPKSSSQYTPLFFPSNNNSLGCEPYTVPTPNAIAVVNRGDCSFEQKSRVAQLAGASTLIVVSKDEEVSAPVAVLDEDTDGPVTIATVMIRSSAGSQLRAAANRGEILRASLVPISCHQSDSTASACDALIEDERRFITTSLATGGYFEIQGEPVGEFVAATFGAPIVTGHYEVQSTSACSESKSLVGKIALVLLQGNDDGCSVLEQIAMVQDAGAVAVLLQETEISSLSRPDVERPYMGYGVHLTPLGITDRTAKELLSRAVTDGNKVQMIVSPKVATMWHEVAHYSNIGHWPTRKARREKLLRRLMTTHHLNSDRFEAIKNSFENVAGQSAEGLWKGIENELKRSASDSNSKTEL